MSLELKTSPLEFIPCMTSYMTEICQDQYERTQAFQQQNLDKSKAISLLAKGIWYPSDYCLALEKFDQKTRLNWLIQNGSTYHGFMPKTFTSIEDPQIPSGKKICEFRLAKDVLPSVALDALGNSACILDCGSTISIATYRALKDLLGTEKFDLLFASNATSPLQIGTSVDNPYLRVFNTIVLPNSDCLQPGDICFFTNIQLYMSKHLFGDGRGYNALCKAAVPQEKSTFIAFGLQPQGCVVAEIEKNLLDTYNLPPKPERFVAPSIISITYENLIKQHKNATPALIASQKDRILTQEQFQELPNRTKITGRVERRMELTVLRPNLDEIQKLVTASLSEVRKVFDRLKSD